MAELDEKGVLVESGLAHGFVAFAGADCEVETEDYEYAQREDLERETGDHDVVSGDWRFVGVCC